jgi:hypothetical protein
MPQSDRTLISTRYGLILTYGTGCKLDHPVQRYSKVNILLTWIQFGFKACQMAGLVISVLLYSAQLRSIEIALHQQVDYFPHKITKF